MSELDEPDPACFEFLPYVGWRYHGDGRSVILSSTVVTKPNEAFDDEQLLIYALASQNLFDTLGGRSIQAYERGKIFSTDDFRAYKSEFVYKFVAEETYEYIQKGSFLISSLGRFREMEKQGNPAGDRFEGSAFSAYRVADRLLAVSTLSGFESMIFSTSKDLANSDVMINKFGPVVLKIKLEPFARTLARLLKAERLEVKNVRYSDLKLFRSELKLSDVSGFPPAITPRLARALREGGRFPSLFAKPKRFTEEREVRIALKLPTDVADWTSVESTDLLPYVTRIS